MKYLEDENCPGCYEHGIPCFHQKQEVMRWQDIKDGMCQVPIQELRKMIVKYDMDEDDRILLSDCIKST